MSFDNPIAQVIIAIAIGVAVIGVIVFLLFKFKNASVDLDDKKITLSTKGKKGFNLELEEALEDKRKLEHKLLMEQTKIVVTELSKIDSLREITLKEQNMLIGEETLKQIGRIKRRNYLQLLETRIEELIILIRAVIAKLSQNQIEQSILKDNMMTAENLDYIVSLVNKKQAKYTKDLLDHNLMVSKQILIEFFEKAISKLSNLTELPDYRIYNSIQKRCDDEIKEDLRIRIIRNGFDKMPDDEFLDYKKRAISIYITDTADTFSDIYWHDSIISRTELYNHEKDSQKEIENLFCTMFEEVRRKTIEILANVEKKRTEALDSLGYID